MLTAGEPLIRVSPPPPSCKDGAVSLCAEGAMVAGRGGRRNAGQAFR